MRAERPLLSVILLAAAALRFVGISHHVVRGAADFDEQNNFLRPIQRMAREGTLDPGVYQGYPGLFNWIAALPTLAGDRLNGYTGAAVGARSTVAAFGVLNVWLAFVVARRLAGPWAGLFAAALLAVSRVDVRAAHYVTPDVLGATALLAVLWLVTREAPEDPPTPARDLVLGGVTGLAAAVKFTGLLAGVPAAAAAFLGGGLRWLGRGLRMAVAAAVVFAVAAPYGVGALLERGGNLTGLGHYYGEKAEQNQMARGGDGGFVQATRGLSGIAGGSGVVLAAAALVLVRPRRAAIPAAAALLASLVILASAAFVYPRHLVPPGAALAVLAGAGLGAALARGRRMAIIALGVGALSLWQAARPTVALVSKYAAPAAVDLAADWIEEQASGPSLVLSALPRLALDPKRFEVRRARSLQDEAPAVAAQYDLLVTDVTRDADALEGFRVLARFLSEEGMAERAITVLAPPAERPSLVEVASVRVDRDVGSIGLAFDPPSRVFRIEVDAGAAEWPREIEVSVRKSPAHEWERAAAAALRPTDKDRRREGGAEGQIYILGAAEIAALRLAGARPGPWTQARLDVLALPEDAPAFEAEELVSRHGPDRRRRRRR